MSARKREWEPTRLFFEPKTEWEQRRALLDAFAKGQLADFLPDGQGVEGSDLDQKKQIAFVQALLGKGYISHKLAPRIRLLRTYREADRPLPTDPCAQLRLEACLVSQLQTNPDGERGIKSYQLLRENIEGVLSPHSPLRREERFIHVVTHKSQFITEIAVEYERFLFTTAYWMVRRNVQDAQDIVQEVLKKMFIQKNPQWPEDDREIRSYIYEFVETAIHERHRNEHKRNMDRPKEERTTFATVPLSLPTNSRVAQQRNGGDQATIEDLAYYKGLLCSPSAERVALEHLEPSPPPEYIVPDWVFNPGPREERQAVQLLADLSGEKFTTVRGIYRRWRGKDNYCS